jgi:hypothetical protein
VNGQTPYETRHRDQRNANNADQTEFTAFRFGRASVEAGISDEIIAGALDDYDPSSGLGLELEPWNKSDLELEAAAGTTMEHITRRMELMGDSYPFVLEGNTLRYKASDTLVYEFCLAISNAPSITKGDFVKLPRTFEQASSKISRAVLGEKAKVLHVGWPRTHLNQRRFKEVMTELNSLTNEWKWAPRTDLPDDPDPTTVKDEGIDFVTWRPFPDKRAAQLFLLGQCACGNDWTNKFDDTNINKLSKWFHPMTYIPPIRAFCTPFCVTDSLLIDASEQAGLVLDRIRLALLAQELAEVEPGIFEDLDFCPLIQLVI